ncbi:MAG: hypothetical protein KGI51_13205 [Rhodospirillales bacterium]|nr:hypothetical protein [Rhodospirillales bacterium]
MAKRAAKPGKPGKARGAGPAAEERAPRSLAWAQGLLCGALVALAPALAVLIAVLAAPSVLALALERAAGRPVLRGVALCNASATVGPVRAFWAAGHGMGAAGAILGAPRVLAIAWGAGAAGWLLAELCPLGLRLALEIAAASRAARLRARREALTRAWELEDRSDTP